MYRHILIPTDGSELAERAVTHGLSLAKFVGAKVTVVIAEEQVVSWSGAAEAFLSRGQTLPLAHPARAGRADCGFPAVVPKCEALPRFLKLSHRR